MANSIRNIISENQTKKDEKNGMLNIIVDFNLQKFMFIHTEADEASEPEE